MPAGRMVAVNLARRLRRLRVGLAVQFAVVAAVVGALMAVMIVHRGIGRINDDIVSTAQRQMNDVLIRFRKNNQDLENAPTWYVDVANKATKAFNDSGIEPPLIQIMTAAGEAEAFDSFSQRGVQYLAYARAFNPAQGYVTVVTLTDFEDQKGSLRLRATLLAVGLTLAAAAAGWFLAARILRPARQRRSA